MVPAGNVPPAVNAGRDFAQVGVVGVMRSGIRASSGVLSPLRVL